MISSKSIVIQLNKEFTLFLLNKQTKHPTNLIMIYCFYIIYQQHKVFKEDILFVCVFVIFINLSI